jgi:hypothetical protein
MRALIKRALVAVLCLVFIAPSALGRSRDWGKAHPKGDGSEPSILATAPSLRLVIIRVWSGIWVPTWWFQPKRAESTTRNAPIYKKVEMKKKGVRR